MSRNFAWFSLFVIYLMKVIECFCDNTSKKGFRYDHVITIRETKANNFFETLMPRRDFHVAVERKKLLVSYVKPLATCNYQFYFSIGSYTVIVVLRQLHKRWVQIIIHKIVKMWRLATTFPDYNVWQRTINYYYCNLRTSASPFRTSYHRLLYKRRMWNL